MGRYKYKVLVYDNFHLDDGERYELGEFDDCAAAIAACKQIIDDFLLTNLGKYKDLYDSYKAFGSSPLLITDNPNCEFSSWDYAEQRVRELVEGG